MFASVLSTLGSSILAGAKGAINEYRPTPHNVVHGSFERIAQQGIANLSYRSPVLADVAQTVLNNFQIEVAKKKALEDQVNSEDAIPLREEVKKNLGENASEKEVHREMKNIISRMNKILTTQGVEEAKKSALFKEYETYFHKTITEKTGSQKTENNTTNNSTTTTNQAVGDNGEVLNRIDSNTAKTVNALEELGNVGPGGISGNPGHGISPGKGGFSFIDPVTGMPSIAAAVGSLGGSFLGKVFDDELIDKFAAKTRAVINGDVKFTKPVQPESTEKEPAKPSKVKPKHTSNIDDILNGISLDLSDDEIVSEPNESVIEKITKPVSQPTKKSRIKPKQTSSIDDILNGISLDLSDEDKVETRKVVETIEKEKIDIAKKTLIAVEELNPNKPISTRSINKVLGDKKTKINEKSTTKAHERKGITGAISDVAGTVVKSAAAVEEGSGIMSTIGSALTGIATVGGAVLAAPALAAAAPWVAGAAGIGALGYGAYKMSDSIKPSKNDSIATIDRLTTEKTNVVESKNNQQPIIISNPTNISTNQQGSPPVLVGSVSIRNNESTFERVQMQDFWSRQS